jgi:hypothetical protein
MGGVVAGVSTVPFLSLSWALQMSWDISEHANISTQYSCSAWCGNKKPCMSQHASQVTTIRETVRIRALWIIECGTQYSKCTDAMPH